jgi:5'-nucleotidase
MQILITNDDGIDSPGLWALAGALHQAGLGDVTIMAPLEEQSGMSMSLPVRRNPHVRRVPAPDPAHAAITAYAVEGTPVACVTVGMLADLCPRPDLIVSGINRGLNTGMNVLLSGTVGAAVIGALYGLPALAISQQFVGDAPMPWATAAWAAVQTVPLLAHLREQGPLVLNVNVPHIHDRADLRGFRQTELSSFFYGSVVDVSAAAPDAQDLQALTFTYRRERVPNFPEHTDDGAVRAGYISLTPLTPLLHGAAVDLRPTIARLS